MGTTAEKLAYLADTKTAIKDAIVAKGVEIPEGTTFRGYADLISGISTGLSDDALALADATPEDVTAGKTFYAGDRMLKTGSGIFAPKLKVVQKFKGAISVGGSKTFTINSKTFVATGIGWCNGIVPLYIAFIDGVNVRDGDPGGDGTGNFVPTTVYGAKCSASVSSTAFEYTLKLSVLSDSIEPLSFAKLGISGSTYLYIFEG